MLRFSILDVKIVFVIKSKSLDENDNSINKFNLEEE